MTQVSIAGLLQKGAIPIIGFSKLERIDEALGVKALKRWPFPWARLPCALGFPAKFEDALRHMEESHHP